MKGVAVTSSKDILRRYRGQQRITNGTFYDPDGADVGLSNVACSACLFSWGDKCAPYKELGYSASAMLQKQMDVNRNRYCEFILSDFDDDDDAKRDIRKLNARLFEPVRRDTTQVVALKAAPKKRLKKIDWFWIIVWIIIIYIIVK